MQEGRIEESPDDDLQESTMACERAMGPLRDGVRKANRHDSEARSAGSELPQISSLWLCEEGGSRMTRR